MIPTKSAVFAFLALAASSVFASDCSLPETPVVPDGSSADMQAMLAG